MVLLNLKLHCIFLAMPAYLFGMRKTHNTILLAINQHDPWLYLLRRRSDVKFKWVKIFVLLLHLFLDWLNDEIKHKFGYAGGLWGYFHCCPLKGAKGTVQNYALHFFVNVARLAQDNGGPAHRPAPQDITTILPPSVQVAEYCIDVVLLPQPIGRILAVTSSTAWEIEGANVKMRILETLDQGQDLYFVGAEPMRIDNTSVTVRVLDEDGVQTLPPFVFDHRVVALDSWVRFQVIV